MAGADNFSYYYAHFMKALRLVLFFFSVATAGAQSIAIPWSGSGHDPQHTGISPTASQSMAQIKWQRTIDPTVQNQSEIFIHYGAPVVTRQNTAIFPIKTSNGDFVIEARDAATGTLKWTQSSDFTLILDYYWLPPFGITLTPKNRIYMPGNGGTVLYHDAPDTAGGATGQMAFYGLTNYQNAPASFNSNVQITTPITSDRYGNIYFGFEVQGATVPELHSGIARIAEDGTGSWVAANSFVNGDSADVGDNCAPALSNDQKSLYFAINTANSGPYLVKIDSRTLQFMSKVRLKDAWKPLQDAQVPDVSSASPTIGPDGDVYFGVLEYSSPQSGLTHNDRGWMLHFDSTLAQTKTPGSFGWDDTASIVPASAVPSYHGTSDYLLLCKYNNYASIGSGDGVNKLAILDPNATEPDPVSNSVTVMKEVITVVGVTPDSQFPQYANAVREWCINTATVDPATKSALVTSEDGKAYRWDFTTNSLSETLVLTNGEGEAYTPTLIAPDGTIFAIASGILFALGAGTP